MSKIKSAFNFIKWTVIVLFGIVLFFSANPFVTIEAGHRGIVFDRFRGGVQEVAWTEGLHFRIPFVQSVTQIPIRTQKVVFVNQEDPRLALNNYSKMVSQMTSYNQQSQTVGSMLAASSDLQDVYIDAVITYHLSPEKVASIYQEVGLDYEAKKVVPRAIDSVKTFTAKYKVADILTKREEIKSKVFDDLRNNLEKDNIILEDVNLTNFDFNPQFKTAIEQKQIEEQKAQKEEYILKQKEIQVQQMVKTAEATKQAKILEGEGIAEYNKLIQQEITEKVLEYKQLENAKAAIGKWNGQYPTTYFGDGGENSPIPLINLQK